MEKKLYSLFCVLQKIVDFDPHITSNAKHKNCLLTLVQHYILLFSLNYLMFMFWIELRLYSESKNEY